MGKNFSPRVSKRQREKTDLSAGLEKKAFNRSDDKLLQGASLEEVALRNINVKDQVRTKFNDSSIKELAANIKENGLIQPLVLHRKGMGYTLICGERRFRAMSSVNIEKCPCFILEDKSPEELMAIQFSENSAREDLHYIDKADGILGYQKVTKASERKITKALGISKSEVHRSLMIARLPKKVREAAKEFNIEKYVLLEYSALKTSNFKKNVEDRILAGEITKRSQLKKIINSGSFLKADQKQTRKAPELPRGLTANAFLKVLKSQSKDMDAQTKKALDKLLKDSKDVVDL